LPTPLSFFYRFRHAIGQIVCIRILAPGHDELLDRWFESAIAAPAKPLFISIKIATRNSGKSFPQQVHSNQHQIYPLANLEESQFAE